MCDCFTTFLFVFFFGMRTAFSEGFHGTIDTARNPLASSLFWLVVSMLGEDGGEVMSVEEEEEEEEED